MNLLRLIAVETPHDLPHNGLYFSRAIMAGDAAQVKSLIRAHPNVDLSSVVENNATVLHLAISSSIKGKANADIIEVRLPAILRNYFH